MEGGLFGLTNTQKIFLYSSQIVPTIVVMLCHDLLHIFLWLQLFYLLVTISYILFCSLEKSIQPYLFNQLTKSNYQIEKGIGLGVSAFLLIVFYGILFLKIGRVVLPSKVDLGSSVHQNWFLFLLAALTNPLLEEWYWRLFLPKVYSLITSQTFQSTYYKSHIINITYLLFHFGLFSKYLGFWRALPLVGTFFSVGRSMSHIKEKFGILSGVITHYGITLASFFLAFYISVFTKIAI